MRCLSDRRAACQVVAASFFLGLMTAPLSFSDEPPQAADVAAQRQEPAAPDFFFGRPTRSLGIRATWLVPREGGDLFRFVRDQLTIDHGDFKTIAATGEFGFAISSRVTLLIGGEGSHASVGSESRHFFGSDYLPITQESQLTNWGINTGVKFALTETGRQISRYAWIPRTLAPYVGGGGGMVYYHFTQTGEFVDYADSSIFPHVFDSTGWGPSAYVSAGTDVRAWRSLYLSAEGRYVWAHAGLDADFIGFEGIDLSGFRMAGGVNVVF